MKCKAHHWRIEEPDGRKELPGVCLNCGVTKLYPATNDSTDFNFSTIRTIAGLGSYRDVVNPDGPRWVAP